MTQPQTLSQNKIDESLMPDLPTQNTTNILDIEGFVEVVDAIPSFVPRKLQESIKIYINGATKRLYVYDYKAGGWLYSALTDVL